LLSERGGELLFADDSSSKKDIADTAGAGFTLKAKSFAKLRIGYGGLLDE
jgi:hypothetical protein